MTPSQITDNNTLEEQTPKSSGKKQKGWAFRTVEFIVLLLIAVVVLETFFKLAGIGEQEFLIPDKQLGSKHIPGKLVTWRMEGYSHDKLSSAGWRDTEHKIQKQPGVVRIALLGDSSTEGLQVPMDDTYGKILERALNEKNQKFEVINFACSGYSTGQELLEYERDVRQYHPDIVLLLYNRGDSLENIFVPGPTALTQPRPYFYLDASNKLQLDPAVLEACSSKLKPHPFWDYLKENSRIYGVISATGLMLSINENQYRKLAAWWNNVTGIFVKNDRPSSWTVPYAKQNADNVTEALLTRLNNEITADGANFGLVIFPNVVQDPDLQRQQSLLELLANKEKFAFFDLTRPFFDNDFHSYFLEYHFSSPGHAFVAKELQPMIETIEKRRESTATQ